MHTIYKLLTIAITIVTLSFFAVPAHAQTTYVLDFTSDGNTTTTNITETDTSAPTSSPTTPTMKSSYSGPIEAPSQDVSLNETPESNTTFQSTDDSQIDSQVIIKETLPSEEGPTPALTLTYTAPLVLLFLLLIVRKKV